MFQIERAQWEQGIRKPLQKGVRRHEWKTAHGFYKTRAEEAMKPINVEITMGHNIVSLKVTISRLKKIF
jgi:hypothetical protein